MLMSIDLKPSDVVLGAIPLVDTMHKAEAELAAALLCLGLAKRGDEFRALPAREMGEVLNEEMTRPPVKHWNNPFVRPDFDELVKRGYAVMIEHDGKERGALQFTDRGIEALRKWVRPIDPCTGTR